MTEEEAEGKKPIIIQRKVVGIGTSSYVVMPKSWLKQHGLENGDEITIVANRDLKVLSPKSVDKYYKEITRIVSEPID